MQKDFKFLRLTSFKKQTMLYNSILANQASYRHNSSQRSHKYVLVKSHLCTSFDLVGEKHHRSHLVLHVDHIHKHLVSSPHMQYNDLHEFKKCSSCLSLMHSPINLFNPPVDSPIKVHAFLGIQ